MITKEQELKIAKEMSYSYGDHEETKVETLQRIDRKVKKPAEIFTYSFGTIGSLVLGVGMCLAMKVIGNLMPLGIIIGIAGIAMVSTNYFIYNKILKSRKKKYAKQVLTMTNELLNNN